MPGSLLYVLQVECEGLRVGVYFNGVQLFVEGSGAQRAAQSVVNPYLVAGRNRLELVAEPAYDDRGARAIADRVLELALVRGEHGREPGPEGLITQTAEGSAPGDRSLFRVWTAEFEVAPGDDFGPWAWESAPAGEPGEGDRDEVVALAEELYAALARGDVAAVSALARAKTREMARALDIDEGDYEREQADFLQGLAAAADWSLEPLERDALVLSPMADGRLVMVTDAEGNPPIRGASDGSPFAMRVTVSKVDGAWTLVR